MTKGGMPFITLSGGEGSGKSTAAKKLAAMILGLYEVSVFCTKQPGGTPFGSTLREILLHGNYPMSGYEELYLFSADRVHHAPIIREELAAGKLVICDRYADDTVAYQGYARGLDLKFVERTAWEAAMGVVPDRSYFLMVDPHTGLSRVAERPDRNTRFDDEKYEFHQKLFAGFEEIAAKNPDRVVLIDASRPKVEVFLTIFADIVANFNDVIEGKG
jgi:dTMP kinase